MLGKYIPFQSPPPLSILHTRGGKEHGNEWHSMGKGLQKKNSFSDLRKISEFLFDKGYTSPRFLAGLGSSAGGLLFGFFPFR